MGSPFPIVYARWSLVFRSVNNSYWSKTALIPVLIKNIKNTLNICAWLGCGSSVVGLRILLCIRSGIQFSLLPQSVVVVALVFQELGELFSIIAIINLNTALLVKMLELNYFRILTNYCSSYITFRLVCICIVTIYINYVVVNSDYYAQWSSLCMCVCVCVYVRVCRCVCMLTSRPQSQ